MNIAETSMVLAKIQAFDNRNVDDATTIAWQEVLEPHTVQDALEAVSDYFRVYSAWIMPAHIVERVRAMEEDRVNQFKNGCHLNPADEDRTLAGAGWSEGMRALHRAVRTGALSPAAYAAYQDGTQPLEAFLGRKAIK
ncbi:MAG TPA: hypothetical protein DDY41_10280 [Arthrobacter bacterium]|jgi:hypothetical protein|nr:hypothetical protein [Arthrobacter sp.]